MVDVNGLLSACMYILSNSDYKYGGGGDIMKTSTDTWTLDSRHVNLD